MYFAKNNIIVKIKNSSPEEYAILNPLTGSFDLMGNKELDSINKLKAGEEIKDGELKEYLLERGYFFKSKSDENTKIAEEYEKFQEEIRISQTQLMLVPTYGCNLACTYCFQHGVNTEHKLISKEAVDAFYNYAAENFSETVQKPFITLFGGEPLVNSPKQREIIKYIVNKAIDGDYEIAFVSNGYDLIDYIEFLKKAKVKEIQLTLDGMRDYHDKRRNTAAKSGTFDRIIDGMAKAIEYGITINLRSVVDNDNIGDLVNLAHFLDEKGWLNLPADKFKTQIGRNYELFECYATPQHLMTQADLWGEYAYLAKKYPVLKKFHAPEFKGIKHMVTTGEMYMASFDTCPAGKTEWVFDLHGDIYGCTASCGREEFKLGKFYPKSEVYTEQLEQWQKRDVLNIPECVECKHNIICGGGCGVVAANKNGKILSPDCRPIEEMIETGVNFYIDDIHKMSEAANEEETLEHVKGCLVCDEPLIYLEQSTEEKCEKCGKIYSTNVKCKDGHFICDTCHKGDILDRIEEMLIKSNQKDPVALALDIFEIEDLKMHGPEYHSIVPGVLTTVIQNIKGIKEPEKIKEAIERGKSIKGGMCGTHGVCGAAAGTGIAYSIANGVSPLSSKERGKVNEITAKTLLKIAQYESPRCCKREAISSIETASENIEEISTQAKAKYVCRQFIYNDECAKMGCPYFPANANKRKI